MIWSLGLTSHDLSHDVLFLEVRYCYFSPRVLISHALWSLYGDTQLRLGEQKGSVL